MQLVIIFIVIIIFCLCIVGHKGYISWSVHAAIIILSIHSTTVMNNKDSAVVLFDRFVFDLTYYVFFMH